MCPLLPLFTPLLISPHTIVIYVLLFIPLSARFPSLSLSLSHPFVSFLRLLPYVPFRSELYPFAHTFAVVHFYYLFTTFARRDGFSRETNIAQRPHSFPPIFPPFLRYNRRARRNAKILKFEKVRRESFLSGTARRFSRSTSDLKHACPAQR